jgi:hypothetical protein
MWWALGAVALAVFVPSGGAIIPPRWEKLNELHPQARTRFLDLFHAIEDAGYQVVITSVWRLGTGDYHGFGLAVDYNLIHIATGKWYRAADKFDKATWEATGVPTIIRGHGFRWGGDFTTPWVYQGVTHPGFDPIHADLGASYSIASLRTRAKALAAAKRIAYAQFDGRNVPLTA